MEEFKSISSSSPKSTSSEFKSISSSSPKSISSSSSKFISSSNKCLKLPSSQSSSRAVRCSQRQPFRLHTESRGQLKERAFVKRLQETNAEEAKTRLRIAQGLPLTTDKPEIPYKPPVKEQTKPVEIKLHTQQRAVRRAGFNDLVATKMNWQEQQRQQLEKLCKVYQAIDSTKGAHFQLEKQMLELHSLQWSSLQVSATYRPNHEANPINNQ